MYWSQFIILVISFVGLFIWNRTESRSDSRQMDQKLESNRNLTVEIYKDSLDLRIETKELMASFHKENRDLIDAIREDIKDFHGRLCSIEERNKSA